MAHKPETNFRRRADVFLKGIPYSWWESVQQKTIRGTPDKIGCIRGLFVAIEFKASVHEKPEPLQQYKLREINEAGGIGLTVFPENFEKVKAYLMYVATTGDRHEPPPETQKAQSREVRQNQKERKPHKP